MVSVTTGHYRCDGNDGEVFMNEIENVFKPLLTVTGFMSHFRLRMLHTAHSYNRQFTTCGRSPGLVLYLYFFDFILRGYFLNPNS